MFNLLCFICSRSATGHQQQLSNPVATSTPRGPVAAAEKDSDPQLPSEKNETVGGASNTRPSSASSELTQISTTDISSHDDLDDDDEDIAENFDRQLLALNTNMNNTRQVAAPIVTSPQSGITQLSDVVVSMDNHARSDSEGSPPPPPTSAPPALDHDGELRLVCSPIPLATGTPHSES